MSFQFESRRGSKLRHRRVVAAGCCRGRAGYRTEALLPLAFRGTTAVNRRATTLRTGPGKTVDAPPSRLLGFRPRSSRRTKRFTRRWVIVESSCTCSRLRRCRASLGRSVPSRPDGVSVSSTKNIAQTGSFKAVVLERPGRQWAVAAWSCCPQKTSAPPLRGYSHAPEI